MDFQSVLSTSLEWIYIGKLSVKRAFEGQRALWLEV